MTDPAAAPGERDEHFDVVIAGGGCAGLSAAVHLVAAGLRGRRVAVVEPRVAFPRDRTFCYWDVGPPDLFFGRATASWGRWRVRAGGREVVRSSARYAYRCLPADAFYAAALERLRAAPEVSLRLGERVVALREQGDGVAVETDRGRLRAGLVLDSRPLATAVTTAHPLLLQHFRGAFVRASRPAFEPGTATLMDFDVSQARGIHFFYVLPTSRDRALVEATYFSNEVHACADYDGDIERYLRGRYGLSAWEIEATEQGVIPMTSAPAPEGSARVVPIGLAGGLAKPSTGYAFRAIQRHSAALAQSIVRGERPSRPRRSARTRALDHTFLSFLVRQPTRAPDAFRALFEDAPADAVVRFLCDAGTLADDLRVIRAAPMVPLASEALRAALTWLPWNGRTPAS